MNDSQSKIYENLLEKAYKIKALFKENYMDEFDKEFGIPSFMPRGEKTPERLQSLRNNQCRSKEEYFEKIQRIITKVLEDIKVYLDDPEDPVILKQFGWQ